eukprot:403864_1
MSFNFIFVLLISNIILVNVVRSNKKGVVIGSYITCNDFNILNSTSWYHSNAPNSTYKTSGCNPLPFQEFIPSIYGYYGATNYSYNYIESNTSYLMGFVEPNNKYQSNLSPTKAVNGWKIIQSVWGSTHKLISPSAIQCHGSVCNTQPITWFDNFFKICNGSCQVDILSTHTYSSNVTQTMQYLQSLSKYNLPIWLSALSCFNVSANTLCDEYEQEQYMKELIPKLEASSLIERYSWSISRSDNVNSLLEYLEYPAELTTLGVDYNKYNESIKIGTGISPTYTECDDLDILFAPKWFYNWAPNSKFSELQCSPMPSQEFVPMIWGYYGATNYSYDFIAANTTHLLGFNEPNHQSQANLQPVKAVEGWKVIQSVWGSNHKLVSPSASPCGSGCIPNYGQPIQWFDEFFKLCNGTCQVDAIATHVYDCSNQSTMNYLQSLAKYGLSIWITEFACGTGSSHTVQQQVNYMVNLLPVLEKSDLVVRYAWFNSRDTATNSLLKLKYGNKLTQLGNIYNSL